MLGGFSERIASLSGKSPGESAPDVVKGVQQGGTPHADAGAQDETEEKGTQSAVEADAAVADGDRLDDPGQEDAEPVDAHGVGQGDGQANRVQRPAGQVVVGKGEQGGQTGSDGQEGGGQILGRVGVVDGVGHPTPVVVGGIDVVPHIAVDQPLAVAQPDVAEHGGEQADNDGRDQEEEELAAADF